MGTDPKVSLKNWTSISSISLQYFYMRKNDTWDFACGTWEREHFSITLHRKIPEHDNFFVKSLLFLWN